MANKSNIQIEKDKPIINDGGHKPFGVDLDPNKTLKHVTNPDGSYEAYYKDQKMDFNDYIDEMVGYGVLTADKGATMKSDYAAMQSNQMQLVESKPGEGAPENEKKDSWWQRRKKRREAERQAENDALYLDDQGNPIMAD